MITKEDKLAMISDMLSDWNFCDVKDFLMSYIAEDPDYIEEAYAIIEDEEED